MRENRTYGSEGGEAKSLPYPYRKGRSSGFAIARDAADGRGYGGARGTLARGAP